VDIEVSSRVVPSGLARATSAAPTVPAAPPTLRIRTEAPSSSAKAGCIIRPMMSLPPPAGNGMTT
jgi:hypothetical protein